MIKDYAGELDFKANSIVCFIENLRFEAEEFRIDSRIIVTSASKNSHVAYLLKFIEKERGYRATGTFIVYDCGETSNRLNPFFGLDIGRGVATAARIVSGGQCQAVTSLFVEEIIGHETKYAYFGRPRPFLGLDTLKKTIINQKNFSSFKNIFEGIITARDRSEFNVVQNALSWFDDSQISLIPYEKLTKIFIGLESLLTEGESEISYKIAIRAAALIGRDSEDKKQIFSYMRKGYDIRSKYIHGGDVVKTADKKMKDLGENDFFAILEFPDIIESYFRKILFWVCENKENLGIFINKNNKERIELLDNLVLETKHIIPQTD